MIRTSILLSRLDMLSKESTEFDKGQNHANGAIPEFGAIFMSSGATKIECLRWRIFGLPSSLASFVEQVKVGMLLFLFDFEKRLLHGVFQARSDGAMNIVPHAFSSSGRTFPAQVKFTLLWHCAPLLEKEFGEVIQDNYFAAKKFNFGLSEEQVRGLLYLFSRKRIKVSIPKKQLTSSVHSNLIYANGAKDEHYVDSGQHSNNAASGASDNSGKIKMFPDYTVSPCERIHSNHEEKTRVGSSSFNWRLWDTTNKLNLNGETEDCPGSHRTQNKNRPVDSLENVGCSAEELRIAPDSAKLLVSRLKENRDEYGAFWPNISNGVPVMNHYNHDASVYLMKPNLGARIHISQSQPRFSSALSQSIELPQYIPCSMSAEDSYLNSTSHHYHKAYSVKYGNPSSFQGYHSSKPLQERDPLQKSTVDIYPCKQKQPPSRSVSTDLANGILKSSSLLQNQVLPRNTIDHGNILSTTNEQFLGPAIHENPTFQPYGNESFGDPSFSSPVPAPCCTDRIPSPHIFSHRKDLRYNHMYDVAVEDTCLQNMQYGRENLVYGSTSLPEDSFDHLLQDQRDPAAWNAAGNPRCTFLGHDDECIQHSETMKSLPPKRESVFSRLALPSEIQLQEKDFSSSEDDVDASPDEIMAMLQLHCHRSQWARGNESSMHIKIQQHGKRTSSISMKSKRGYPKGSSDDMGMGSIRGGDHQAGDGPFLNFKRRSEVRKAQNQINAEDAHETLSSKDGEMVEERPFLDFKSRSQVQNAQIQSNAEGYNVTLTSESPSVAQGKRRKLIRPNFSFDKKGAPDEGCNKTLTGESPSSVSQVKRRRLIRPNFSFDKKGALVEDFGKTSTSVSPSVAQAERKKLIRPNLSSDKKEPDEKAICAGDSQPCELKSHDCWLKTEGNNNEVLFMSQNTCNLSRAGDNEKPSPNISGEKNSSIVVDLLVVGDGSLKEPLQDFCVKASPHELLCKDEIGSSDKDTSCKNFVADGSGKERNLFTGQATSPHLLLQETEAANSDKSINCKNIVAVGSGKKSSILTDQPAIPNSSPETETSEDGKSGQMVHQRIESSGFSPTELTFMPLGDPVQSEIWYAGIDDISRKSRQCSSFEAVSKEKECELGLCLGRPLSLDTLPPKKINFLDAQSVQTKD